MFTTDGKYTIKQAVLDYLELSNIDHDMIHTDNESVSHAAEYISNILGPVKYSTVKATLKSIKYADVQPKPGTMMWDVFRRLDQGLTDDAVLFFYSKKDRKTVQRYILLYKEKFPKHTDDKSVSGTDIGLGILVLTLIIATIFYFI